MFDLITAYSEKLTLSKVNAKPICILPNTSKVCERWFYGKLSKYFDNNISKFYFNLHNGYSALHFLLSMIKNWEKIHVDIEGIKLKTYLSLSVKKDKKRQN